MTILLQETSGVCQLKRIFTSLYESRQKESEIGGKTKERKKPTKIERIERIKLEKKAKQKEKTKQKKLERKKEMMQISG